MRKVLFIGFLTAAFSLTACSKEPITTSLAVPISESSIVILTTPSVQVSSSTTAAPTFVLTPAKISSPF